MALVADFVLLVAEPAPSSDMSVAQSEFRSTIGEAGAVVAVAMVHIHNRPTSFGGEDIGSFSTFFNFVEKTRAKSIGDLIFSLELKSFNLNTKQFRNISISAVFILIEKIDQEALDMARIWVKWASSLNIKFSIGATRAGQSFTPSTNVDFFSFFYVAHDDNGLMQAPRLILDHAKSMISYDFSDLRSLWTGGRGEVWTLPAEPSALQGILEGWNVKNSGDNHPGLLCRYDGPGTLIDVGELMDVVRASIQTDDEIWAAWQTNDPQAQSQLELCLIGDHS
jgi:hypothetical protein